MTTSTSPRPVATFPEVDSGPIIKATGVAKTYDTGELKVEALRDVNLTINRGEMVAVMGPSGCGKTTLLNCLSGLDTIDAGEIAIANANLAALSDDKRTAFRANHMGFIFQFYNLLPVLDAVENVELPLLVSGVRPGEARKRALAMLDRVGLEEWATHRPGELSGGQRQRVTIARALVNEPAIVWGDEPTGDLDSKNAKEILDLLRDLNLRNRQTFVLVTHDPNIGAMCDRIIHMHDGTIVNETHNNTASSID